MARRRRSWEGPLAALFVLPALTATGCKVESGAAGTDGGASASPSGSKGSKTSKGPKGSNGHDHSASPNANEAAARKELKQADVAAPGSMTGYSREAYGPAWKDEDHNGCDTRDDILARDLDDVRKRGTCVVISGELDDPYTGKHLVFAKARAIQVQIDHVFPLALAWRMGADDWTEAHRAELANDRDNLLAVWSRPNEQKGDKGPAEWKPRRSFQCRYAERFIGVAHEYRLAVTAADRSALAGMLDTC